MPRAKKPLVRTERAQAITDRLYEESKQYQADFVYSATLKRVRELIAEREDADEVECVALALLDQDKGEFASWRSLGWGAYAYFRDMLDVPKGGWPYALAMRTAPPRYADTIDYWLRRWRDGELADEPREVWLAQQKLAALLERLRLESVPVDAS